MTVHWGSLLAVFLVSLGAAVTVVALVATARGGSRPASPPTRRRRRDCPAERGWPSPPPA